jgi:hypothetical protein
MENNTIQEPGVSFMNGYMAIENIFGNLQFIEKELVNVSPASELEKEITKVISHFLGEMYDVRDFYSKLGHLYNIFLFDILVMETEIEADPALFIMQTLRHEANALHELVMQLQNKMEAQKEPNEIGGCYVLISESAVNIYESINEIFETIDQLTTTKN